MAPPRWLRATADLVLPVRCVGCGRRADPFCADCRADALDLRVREVDVDYSLRTEGSKSKVTGTLLGTVRTIRDMRGVLAR